MNCRQVLKGEKKGKNHFTLHTCVLNKSHGIIRIYLITALNQVHTLKVSILYANDSRYDFLHHIKPNHKTTALQNRLWNTQNVPQEHNKHGTFTQTATSNNKVTVVHSF